MIIGGSVKAFQKGMKSWSTDRKGLPKRGSKCEFAVTRAGSGDVVATVEFNPIPIYDGPIASHEIFMIAEDSSACGNVLAHDADAVVGAPAVVMASSSECPFTTANGGALILCSDGTMSYRPANRFKGNDSFDYSISDGRGHTARANVTFVVTSTRRVSDGAGANKAKRIDTYRLDHRLPHSSLALA